MRLVVASLVTLAAALVAAEAKAGDPAPSPPIVISTDHVALTGPARVHGGERVQLRSTAFPAALCYRPGTATKVCAMSQTGTWLVTIRRGRTQYFTVIVNGFVFGRLVYHEVA